MEAKPPLRFRKLRIAWSAMRSFAAVFAMAFCLVVLAFWVRTGTWHHFLFGDGSHDLYVGRTSRTHDFAIVSMKGNMRFCWFAPYEELGESTRRHWYGYHSGNQNSFMFFEGDLVRSRLRPFQGSRTNRRQLDMS